MIGSIGRKISTYSDCVVSGITKAIPSWTATGEKTIKNIKWIGNRISSPQNRLILGASALVSQPFIDLYNKNVDDKTRKTSAARTVAKIIAGTTTGFLVRYYSIKAIDAMTKEGKNVKAWEKIFTPDMVKSGLKDLKQYRMALGTIISLGVMILTNFLIDAPLTKFLTNKFIDKIDNADKAKTAKLQEKTSAIKQTSPPTNTAPLQTPTIKTKEENNG